MIRDSLEARARRLEAGLDDFEGEQWILRVGEIARIKALILNMTPDSDAKCRARLGAPELSELDGIIARATSAELPPNLRRQAFMEACVLFSDRLTRAFR